MRKHVSNRMLRGIAMLVFILAAITLGIRIYLDEALIRHASTMTTEAAPSETREQLIIAETMPLQESEVAEEPADQITQFEASFAEIQALEEIAVGERQGSALKEDYTTIAKLWNRELESIGRAITAHMTESEKEAYIASASAFLISRNHECMKELDQDKLSVMENIDYLSREIALTRERCYDLLKDYRSYLA